MSAGSPIRHRPVRPPYAWPLAAIIAATTAVIAPAGAQTLSETLAAAYLANPDLAVGRARLDVVNEQRPQALGGFLPNLSASASRDVQDLTYDGVVNRTNRQDQQALTLNQPVYSGGAASAGLDRAESTIRAERARLRTTESEVLLAAVTAHMDVARDLDVLNLNRQARDLLVRRLDQTRALHDLGDATAADLAQARARVADAEARVVAAEAALAKSQATYLAVTGQEPTDPTPAPLPAHLPDTLGAALLRAREANPQIVAAGYDTEAATDGIAVSRGALLPKVSVTGSLSRNRSSLDVNPRETEAAAVGLQLTVPIYSAGIAESRLREARKTAAEARLSRLATERSIVERTERVWRDMLAARAAIAAREAQVEAATTALDGVAREVDLGRRPLIDLLDAQRDLLDASEALAGARRDVVVAAFGVLAATGGLEARALALDVPYHDPTGDYEAVKWRVFVNPVTGE
ncbi:TolC family outer membrane protein [Tistrella mobilis]|uniref:TolC family outer membrane protein n=1 Tax=Tistrella mobilis TaxID=171437 RepID=UPI0035564004